jgi:hypothetical protein
MKPDELFSTIADPDDNDGSVVSRACILLRDSESALVGFIK